MTTLSDTRAVVYTPAPSGRDADLPAISETCTDEPLPGDVAPSGGPTAAEAIATLVAIALLVYAVVTATRL